MSRHTAEKKNITRNETNRETRCRISMTKTFDIIILCIHSSNLDTTGNFLKFTLILFIYIQISKLFIPCFMCIAEDVSIIYRTPHNFSVVKSF